MGISDYFKNKFQGMTWQLIFTSVVVTVGTTFPFGYNMVVINAPQEVLEQFFNESYNATRGEYMEEAHLRTLWSLNACLYTVGAMIGCMCLGFFADLLGRKRMMLCINFVIFGAACLMGFSKHAMSFEMIIVGRFIFGFVAGLCSVATIYFMEIAPRHLRGALGGLYELGFASSMLMSTVLGLPEVFGNDQYWPILLSFTAFTSVLQLWTLPFSKESPRYLLVKKGQEDEAKKALQFFRGKKDVEKEMAELRHEAIAQKNMKHLSWLDILRNPALRKAMYVAWSIQMSLQLGGVIAVLYYSTKLFSSIGIEYPQAAYASVGIGLMKLLMNMLSMYCIERFGRRIPQLIGTFGQGVMTTILIVALSYQEYDWAKIMSVGCCILFIAFDTFGPATICFMITPELFQENARPAAVSMSLLLMYFFNTLVGVTFPHLKELMGPYVFLIFSCCSFVLTVVIYKIMPETKGRTINDIVRGFGLEVPEEEAPGAIEGKELMDKNAVGDTVNPEKKPLADVEMVPINGETRNANPI